MGGKESKWWGHTAKLVAGLAALLLLGVLASGAVADPSDPLGGVTGIFTGASSTDTTTSSDSTSTGSSAPSDSTATSTDSASTSTGTATTDTTTTAADTSPAAFQYGTTSTDSTTTAAAPTGPPVSYIVTFKDGVSDATQQADISVAGGTPGDAISVLSMYSATFPAGEDATDAAALAANSDVAAVEQDHSRDTAAIPNDPSYGSQWSLPQIGWDNAYGTVSPGGSATVAILDTGIDASHADLSGVVVPGKNMIDGTSNTADDNGHGTAMAGIVAADTNNGVGIAGVGYAGVKVMPVKVLDSQGLGLDSDVINGVVYATQHGANVILMSFSNPGYSSALQTAINYAWSHGVVLVAATGNDGSSTVNYPAGDKGVIGVGSTELGDIPTPSSNTGADVFLAAPGEGILSASNSGGYDTISGTSASAAAVAGAAALIKASDFNASNGVIVNRLAETADPAGNASQTGNGRLNLDRAINDTSTTSIEPAGAAPNGSGGPFVGPYVAAAQLSGQIQGKSNPVCSSGGICPWQTTSLTGWAELQTVPLRLFFAAGQTGLSNTFTISIDHANGNTQGLDGLVNWSKTANISGITINGSGTPTAGVSFLSSTNGSGATTWDYTFTVTINDANAGEIDFTTALLSGAHQFTGSSLQVKGAGTLGFVKPAAAPGTTDLSLTKTALANVAPGQTMTYTLSYRNLGPDNATNAQITDILPAGVTYVSGSCSGTCSYDSLSRQLSFTVGGITAGAVAATKTYQVTVDSGDANGFTFTNNARIFGSETDPATTNNQSAVTTTVVVPGISGTVLADLNGNGLADDGGAGVANATIKLYLDTSNAGANAGVFDAGDTQVGSTITTPASGDWTFGPLTLAANRTYFVVRANASGYTSTGSIAGSGLNTTTTTVAGNLNVIKVVFGAGTTGQSANNKFLENQASGSIAGTVYNDANGDGLSAGDSGKSGVTVFIDANNDGNKDAGEASTTSGATGGYSFTGLAAGTYHVSFVVTTGWANTGTRPQDVTLTAGQNATGKDFLEQERDASIAGTVYNDANGDGLSAGDSGKSGVTVFIDANNDGNKDAGEASTTSGATGGYSFTGLAAGTYHVSFVVTTGWANTGTRPQDVTLTAGQNATGKDFLEQERDASIAGTVYNDANGDGLSAGDSGKSGVTVFIDANNDGNKDAGEASTTTDGTGAYSFTGLAAGTYHVSFVVTTGWANTGTRPQDVTLTAGQNATGKDFLEQERDASIAGTVYNDANGDGLSAGDSGKSGVTVFIDANNDGNKDAGEASTTSGATGGYSFTGLAAGTYHVSFVVTTGWANTGTRPQDVTLTAGQNATGKDFLEQERDASIAGTVYNDANGDGLSAGDSGKSGVTVFIDANNDGNKDAGEASTTSGATGGYSFTGLAAGTYHVSFVVTTGWANTGTRPQDVTLTAGQNATGKDFLEQERDASIAGTVYNDANGDGLSAGDSGKSGVTVFIDANNDGNKDAGEASTTSGATGGYSFTGLAAGTYHVSFVVTTGWANTGTRPQDVTLTAGQNATGKDFLEQERDASIAGTVYNDANGDGLSAGDSGKSGVTVFIDANNDGNKDAGEASTTSGATGGYSFTGLAAGTYHVSFVVTTGWANTGTRPQDVTLTAGQNATGKDFLEQERDASIAGTVYNDANGDGLSAGDSGKSGVTVFIDANNDGNKDAGEASTTSGATGGYSFTGLAAGTYHVSFVVTTGWANTGTRPQDVTLTAGQNATGKDFLEQERDASIAGTVYNDANGDGLSAGDSGKSGVTVFIDANNDGNKDAGEASTTTDGTGAYSFTGLAAGTYHVSFVVTTGWANTGTRPQDVTLTAGQNATGKDFLEQERDASIAGTVYNDANGDGLSAGDSGKSGVTVFIDANNDGNKDAGEASTTSGATGGYSFTGLAAGTYHVSFVVTTGWANTGTRPQDVTLTAGQNATGKDFLEQERDASIAGTVYNDANGDGLSAGDSGKSGVTVFIDANNDGNKDAGEASTTSGATGGYSFTGLAAGTYHVSFVVTTGWANTGTRPQDVTLTAGQNATGKDFLEQERDASIAGTVYNDANGDGLSAGDSGKSGVTVFIDANNDGNKDAGEASTTSGATGGYSFTGLAAGTYHVSFVVTTGWANTGTRPQDVTLTAGQNATGKDFLEQERDASIAGTVYNDANGDGLSAGDSGKSGVTVFIDANNDGNKDAGEASTTTDGTGAYSFTGLAAGTYHVSFVVTTGWANTGTRPQDVTLTAGQNATGKDFLEQERDASIAGTVYNDANGDGLSAGDSGKSGVTVFIDANNDGNKDAGEASTTSGATGGYSFTGLAAGTYHVSFVVTTGWANTGTRPQDVTLTAGQNATGKDFLEQERDASIAGTVYNDANGDGLSAGDSGKSGVTVFIDANNDGNKDAGEASTTTDGTGAYSFTGLAAGTYHVSFVVTTGWANTGTRPQDVTLTAGQNATGKDFLEQERDASIAGTVYNDANGDGLSAGDSGKSGVTVFIDANNDGNKDAGEASTTSGATGGYSFTGLAAGTYHVSFVVTTGWANTGTRPQDVTLTAGQNATGKDFLEQERDASIAGTVYNDANGDGLSAGDSGKSGVTVFIDANNDGNKDAGEASTTTDGTGAYSFTGLAAGTYHVSFVVTTGWANTGTRPQDVTLTAGQNATGKDFLEQERDASIAGTVYNDANGDGLSAGDSGKSGVTVFIDANNDGNKDAGEASTTSGATGGYSFTGLAAGTYHVSFVVTTGWANTGTRPQDVTLTAGQNATGKDFLEQERDASIAGTVYNDANGDGLSAGDSGKSGVTVFIDANNDGNKDAGEASTTTDGTGAYSFTGLAAGTYHVSFVVTTGWANTGTRPQDVTLTAGQNATGKDFLEQERDASIAGTVYNDANGDGLSAGDSGKSGVTVFIDANNDGNKDAGEASTTSGATGGYSFTGLAAGTYHVSFVVTTGWANTGTRPQDVTLTAGQNATGKDFLEQERDASIAGTVYNDANGDGLSAGDSGKSGVTVFIDANNDGNKDAGEASTTSGATGGYSFTGLAAGTYHVSFVVTTGWANTGTRPQDVTLTAGQNATGKDFLEQERDASIAGTVYNDANGDGLSAGDSGKSGVTVFIDANNDGNKDAGEASTTSGATGGYSFTGLAAGTYHVSFVVTTGWANTGTRPQDVTLTAGQNATGKDFLEQERDASIAGTVYNDANGDGLSAGDSGKSGVTVFIDANNDGNKDAGEASTTSGATGGYSFTGLAAGTYHVSFVVTTGWANTGTRPQDVTLTAGQNATGKNLFEQRATSTALAITTGSNPSTYGSPLTLTATVTSASDMNPNSQGTVTFKQGTTTLCASVALSGNTATCSPSPSLVVGTYSLTAIYSGYTSTPGFGGSTSSPLSLTVNRLEAPVAYIGQTVFTSSGSSSTTAQVTLTASVQDPDGNSGANVTNATVTFTDLLTGKVLASGVKVSAISGTITTGTANTVVTLSTGQYGAQAYLIEVSLGNMYKNTQQTGAAPGTDPYNAAHANVTVMIPPTKFSVQGAATITKLTTAAGTYGDASSASYAMGIQYNSKGTNTQGQIQLILQRADGLYYVKSNSITSVAFAPASGTQPSKDVTIYTKASIYKVNNGVLTSIDGGVTLRVDAHEGCGTSPTCASTSGDKIAFTVLSGKDSSLYYSNNWIYDTTILGWRTVQQPVSVPCAVIIN